VNVRELLFSSKNGFVNRLCNVGVVLLVETAHVDATAAEQVDVEFVNQHLDLRLVEARVGEHADLLSDVIPRSWRLEVDELTLQQVAHFDDSRRHRLDRVHPFLAQVGSVQNFANDATSEC